MKLKFHINGSQCEGTEPSPSKLNKVWRKVEDKAVETCTVNLLRRKFPVLIWMPTYNWNVALYDLVAGITVGLTCIPTCIAYAAIAGLPLQVWGS